MRRHRTKLIVLGCLVAGAIYFTVMFFILSSLSHNHRDISARPNCALVDDALQNKRKPSAAVLAACEASARGLIESLSPADLTLLRQLRPPTTQGAQK